jgi:hypothetical protein
MSFDPHADRLRIHRREPHRVPSNAVRSCAGNVRNRITKSAFNTLENTQPAQLAGHASDANHIHPIRQLYDSQRGADLWMKLLFWLVRSSLFSAG